jgi:hypothetical protein
VHDDASLLSWRGEEPWSILFLTQFPVLESVTYLLHHYGPSGTRDKDEDLSESERDLASELYVSVWIWTCRFCGSSVVTGKGIMDTTRVIWRDTGRGRKLKVLFGKYHGWS